MKVQDPEGRTWRVTRRWTPWRRRMRDVVDTAPDVPLGSIDGPLSLVVAVVVAVLLVPLVVSAALVALELLLLGLLVPLAAAARVVLGRRWIVEVREGFRPRYEELTGDWRQAGDRITELARGLETGGFTVPRDATDPSSVVRHDPGVPGRRPGQGW